MFVALLRFLYHNQVELTTPLALDLYAVAHEYMQTELVGLCEKYLARHITLENLMTIIDIIQKFEANSLRTSVVDWIKNNFEVLKESHICDLLPCSYTLEVISKLRSQLQSKNQP